MVAGKMQDKHGNYLAIKDIHTGPVLRLKIPKTMSILNYCLPYLMEIRLPQP
jgi:hypothetical protein